MLISGAYFFFLMTSYFILRPIRDTFAVAAGVSNLPYMFLGTLIGVLPGIGPLATMAMLLPLTYTLPPVSALIMLAGIYYGSDYGGSTTAIPALTFSMPC